MRIGSWNVNGLINNLKCNDFRSKLKKYDIIGLTETHHSSQSNISLAGYDFFDSTAVKRLNKGRKSGGLVIYYKKLYKGKITYIKSASRYIMWVCFKANYFTNLTHDMYIALVYARPNTFRENDPLYTTLMGEIIKYANKGTVSLMGDFNARVGTLDDFFEESQSDHIPLPNTYTFDVVDKRRNSDYKTNVCGIQLLELCKAAELRIVNGRTAGDNVGSYTCYRPAGKSVVDYFIVPSGMLNDIIYFKVDMITPFSDHALIEIKLNYELVTTPDVDLSATQTLNPPLPRYRWTRDNIDSYSTALLEEEIQHLQIQFLTENYSNSKPDVERALAQVTNIMNQAGGKCMQTTRTKRTFNRHIKRKPWFSENCNIMSRDLKNMASNMKGNPHCKDLHSRYFQLRKKYKKLLKAQKRNYRDSLLNELHELQSNDPKEFWNILEKLKNCDEVLDTKIHDNIPGNEWVDHFRQISEKKDVHYNNELLQQISELEQQIPIDSFKNLNNAITISETKGIIKKLKNNKSSSYDLILNEMIKHGSSILLPSITKLFNLVLTSSYFPDRWNDTIITVLHKKGSLFDTNNYRGISITSCLGKCFTAIMAERILNCLEISGLLHFSQAAFRKKSRTTDHIFSFKSIINKYCLHEKKKLYCCFIDFKKAFDSVWRDALLYKLLKLGIGGPIYFLLKTMYSRTSARVKLSSGLTDPFISELGIKQGDCLSPVLFNIFINDISEIFDNTCDAITLGDLKFNHLLFADDLVLFSETSSGLQTCLDKLNDYTNKWILDINVDKTKTVIFQRYGKQPMHTFKMGKFNIEQVKTYTYLGIQFNSSGCFTSVENELKAKAIKASFKLQTTLNSFTNQNYEIHLKLFDSLIRPIATYGCEVWYPTRYKKIFENADNSLKNIDKIPCELLHNAFCKRLLGVYKSCNNTLSKVEIGRLPISFFITVQVIKYWNHILNKPRDSLLRQSYISEYNNSSDWVLFVKNILHKCGFSSNWDTQSPLDKKSLFIFKRELRHTYVNLYSMVKKPDHLKHDVERIGENQACDLKAAKYLTLNMPLQYKKTLTRIRLQSNRLGIIRGRYTRPITPVQDRLCPSCSVLDDEAHLILHCRNTAEIRDKYSSTLSSTFTDYRDKTDEQKLNLLLYPRSTENAILCGKYLKLLSEERNII